MQSERRSGMPVTQRQRRNNVATNIATAQSAAHGVGDHSSMCDEIKTRFAGLEFSNRGLESAAEEILATTTQPFQYVVTPNVHHIVQLQDLGHQFRTDYASAWRIYCDSRILSRIARLFGVRLEVVTGSDLTARVIAKASTASMKVAVIGPDETDCKTLKARFPGLDIHSYAPPMGFIKSDVETQRCVDFASASGASLFFLAVGMPQQEILAQRIAQQSGVNGVGLCIGASIDFLTGKQVRAPLWMQRSGLEWLHRLGSNPRRLARRYLIECPRIFPVIMKFMLEQRLRR